MITFRLTYTLDATTGHYIIENCPPGFNRCPRELVVEEKRFNDRIKVNLLLRGTETAKKSNGLRYSFFTGLQLTHKAGTFIGNVLTFGRDDKKIQNAVVVRFAADSGRLILWYVPSRYPFSNSRQSFIDDVISS